MYLRRAEKKEIIDFLSIFRIKTFFSGDRIVSLEKDNIRFIKAYENKYDIKFVSDQLGEDIIIGTWGEAFYGVDINFRKDGKSIYKLRDLKAIHEKGYNPAFYNYGDSRLIIDHNNQKQVAFLNYEAGEQIFSVTIDAWNLNLARGYLDRIETSFGTFGAINLTEFNNGLHKYIDENVYLNYTNKQIDVISKFILMNINNIHDDIRSNKKEYIERINRCEQFFEELDWNDYYVYKTYKRRSKVLKRERDYINNY